MQQPDIQLFNTLPATNVPETKEKNIFKRFRSFFTRPKKKMTPEDRVNLNWVQKWVKYRRFPWKVIFHTLLTIACTSMVFLQTSEQTPFVVSIDATWYKLFFPPDFTYDGDYGDNDYYFYNITDVADNVVYALTQHEDFPLNSVVPFQVFPIGDAIAELTVRSYQDCVAVYNPDTVQLDVKINSTTYAVSVEDLGPFENLTGHDLQSFFDCMQTMTITFGYTNTHLQYNRPLTYVLRIKLVYDNEDQSGRIGLTMTWTKESATTIRYAEVLHFSKTILDLAIIAFAILSQILSWVSIGKSFRLYARTKRRLSRKNLLSPSPSLSAVPSSPISSTASFSMGGEISWKSLPIRTKLRFFNMWFVISILGNTANIVAALLDFVAEDDSETGPFKRFLLGIGTLLAWINLIRYLEFDKKYTILIQSLQRGFPSALRFLMGVAPVFVGFALFGLSYLSESTWRFSTFGTACVTLFGLQIGDDMNATFQESAIRNEVVGRVFLAVFAFISIYGVANIFIAIMEESYSMTNRLAEQEERKNKVKRGGIGATQEGDLNFDDDLWNTVLGLSKPSVSPIISPRDIPLSRFDSDDSEEERKKKKKKKKKGKGKRKSGEEEIDEEDMERFMELLDSQHAQFRADTQASLHEFLAQRYESKGKENKGKESKGKK